MPRKRRARRPRCAAPSKVTPAFGPDGTLWLAWMAGGQVSVASSKDAGAQLFGAGPGDQGDSSTSIGGRTRGRRSWSIASGGIALAFSIFRDKAFNGQVLYTRSTDGGKSFAALRPITANNESQRFEALASIRTERCSRHGSTSAIAFPRRRAAGNTRARGCSSRRRTTAARPIREARAGGRQHLRMLPARSGIRRPRPSGRGVQKYLRGRRARSRGHDVHRVSTPGEVHRVSKDDWQIAACPHHGPSLVDLAGRDLSRRLVHQRQGAQGTVLCALARRGPDASLSRCRSGSADRNPTRPYVLAGAAGTAMVWKEFDGEKTTVKLMTSRDDGETLVAAEDDRRARPTHPIIRCWSPTAEDLSVLDDKGGWISLAADRETSHETRFAGRDLALAASARRRRLREAAAAEAVRARKLAGVLRAHAGRPTLVHFWGVTCGPCKVELPLLGQFMKAPSRRSTWSRSAPISFRTCRPPRSRCSTRPGCRRPRTGSSTTVLSSGCGSRSIPPGRATSRARMLISRDGTITTIEGSAEMADLEKWSGQQLATQTENSISHNGKTDMKTMLIRFAARSVRSRAVRSTSGGRGRQGRRSRHLAGLEPGDAGRRQDRRRLSHHREQGDNGGQAGQRFRRHRGEDRGP